MVAGPMSWIDGIGGSDISDKPDISMGSSNAAPQIPSVLQLTPSEHTDSPTGQFGLTWTVRLASAISGGLAELRTCTTVKHFSAYTYLFQPLKQACDFGTYNGSDALW